MRFIIFSVLFHFYCISFSLLHFHLGGGKGRAGTYLACFLVKHGLDYQAPETNETEESYSCPPKLSSSEAISLLRHLRPGSIETEDQERVIKAYSDLLWKRASGNAK